MYSSNPSEYQKQGAFPAAPQAPPYGPAPGIPVASGSSLYSNGQPPVYQVIPRTEVPWVTGLCDCVLDIENCCMTMWCPCITFGQITDIVDNGTTSCGASGTLYTLLCCLTGGPCVYSCLYRSKMRQQYMLRESPCGDCLVHWCCETCALCQEYRELTYRGFDVSIGWRRNMERHHRGLQMPQMPPVYDGGMRR